MEGEGWLPGSSEEEERLLSWGRRGKACGGTSPLPLRLPSCFQDATSGLEEQGRGEAVEEGGARRRMRAEAGGEGAGTGSEHSLSERAPCTSPGGKRVPSSAAPAGPGRGAPA